jgi:hypothetical protein
MDMLPQTNDKNAYISILPVCTHAPFFINKISSPLTLMVILQYCIVPMTVVSNLKMPQLEEAETRSWLRRLYIHFYVT